MRSSESPLRGLFVLPSTPQPTLAPLSQSRLAGWVRGSCDVFHRHRQERLLPVVLNTKAERRNLETEGSFPAQTISWQVFALRTAAWSCAGVAVIPCGMTGVVFCCRPKFLQRCRRSGLSPRIPSQIPIICFKNITY